MLIGHGDKHLKANNQRGEKEEMLQLHLLRVLQKDQVLVGKKTADTQIITFAFPKLVTRSAIYCSCQNICQGAWDRQESRPQTSGRT